LKILVTGGAGFIGSNFVRRILDGTLKGYSSVTVLDKLTYAGNLSNLSSCSENDFEFIEGDICDFELMETLVAKNDLVVNFAAESHVDRSINGARDFVLTNVLGTQTLLEASLKGNITKFMQVSTDEVYGSIETGSWKESEPLLPNSPYAATKASADLLVRSYSRTYDLNVNISRCSNNYGPYQFPEKVIPLFVTNLIRGRNIPLYGNGLNTRDWLHVDDHCAGIHKIVFGGKPGEIYNIGGGKELTNVELTHNILQILEKDENYIEKVRDRLGHDLRYSVNIDKIKNELGYEPLVDWEQGLLETINWYMENEKWWIGHIG
jgi:dTDP-glucose 4,6-dehydratase